MNNDNTSDCYIRQVCFDETYQVNYTPTNREPTDDNSKMMGFCKKRNAAGDKVDKRQLRSMEVSLQHSFVSHAALSFELR